jgi:hypothetical protein
MYSLCVATGVIFNSPASEKNDFVRPNFKTPMFRRQQTASCVKTNNFYMVNDKNIFEINILHRRSIVSPEK